MARRAVSRSARETTFSRFMRILSWRLFEVAIDVLLDRRKGFFGHRFEEVLVDQLDVDLLPQELIDEPAVRRRHGLDRIGIVVVRS